MTIAGRIRGCVRTSDTVARLGGDEFAILLEDVLDPYDVDRVTSSVLAAVIEQTEVNGHLVSGQHQHRRRHLRRLRHRRGHPAQRRHRHVRGQGQGQELRGPLPARARLGPGAQAGDGRRAAAAVSRATSPVRLPAGTSTVHSGEVVGLEALARWRHQGRTCRRTRSCRSPRRPGWWSRWGSSVLDLVARDALAISRLRPARRPPRHGGQHLGPAAALAGVRGQGPGDHRARCTASTWCSRSPSATSSARTRCRWRP